MEQDFISRVVKARAVLQSRGIRPDVLRVTYICLEDIAPFALCGKFYGMTIDIGDRNEIGGRRKVGKFEVVPRVWEPV